MSTLRTNALEGMDAKNSITIVAGAGNVSTTNVQQGLCKVWCHFTGTGTVAIDNSFNSASITDTATGRYTVNFSNSYGNASYTCSVMSGSDGTTGIGRPNTVDATPTTSAFAFRVLSAAGDGDVEQDDTNELFTSHGDLA